MRFLRHSLVTILVSLFLSSIAISVTQADCYLDRVCQHIKYCRLNLDPRNDADRECVRLAIERNIGGEVRLCTFRCQQNMSNQKSAWSSDSKSCSDEEIRLQGIRAISNGC